MNKSSFPNTVRAMGLHYASDQQSGIRREIYRKGFRYRFKNGRLVRDKAILRRIQSLSIPPAWHEVWICRSEGSHLQVTGRDDRKRKQHIYHPRWRMIRDETKYHRLTDFARALPKIRTQVRRDAARPVLDRKKVMATLVRLLAVSLIRIGNEDSARENHTYGLTTLKNRHAKVRGARIQFHFRGKSGKEHMIDVEDKRLAKSVRACQELPGQDLFQYVDTTGQKHAVGSGDVNDYLRTITAGDFTAKDFRTWAGTLSTLTELRKLGDAISPTIRKRNIVAAIKATAKRLGNTAAVCRKSYIHPALLKAYSEGKLISALNEIEKKTRRHIRGLSAEELLLVQFLKQKR